MVILFIYSTCWRMKLVFMSANNAVETKTGRNEETRRLPRMHKQAFFFFFSNKPRTDEGCFGRPMPKYLATASPHRRPVHTQAPHHPPLSSFASTPKFIRCRHSGPPFLLHLQVTRPPTGHYERTRDTAQEYFHWEIEIGTSS
jgi:hypothetical protein